MTIEELIAQAESGLTAQFARIDRMEEIGTRRVLDAFREHQVAYRHFAPTTGYGYDDVGRDTLEKIFAELFGTQAAIVRPQIASGTHAISLCLFGLVLPGDDIVSATGMPYDTLQDIIGWGEGDAPVGSLREMGVSFHPVALRGGKIDLDAVENAITPKTKLVIAQRSRGYDWRPSLMPEEFAPLAKMLHEKHPGVRLMVDNCYGEFVCETLRGGRVRWQPHQESGRRTCPHGRLHRRHAGCRRAHRLPPDRAGHRAGSWFVFRKLPAVLSGIVHGAAHRCAGH